MKTENRTRIADYKGIQGRAWRIWKVVNTNVNNPVWYEVEMVCGGPGGVVFEADTLDVVEKWLDVNCAAKKIVDYRER